LAKATQNNSKLDTKKIYLIRHGQTDFNKLGIVQGSGVDSSLNDLGKQQARAFFEDYRGIQFDKIYTSALKRSIESVQDFIASGIPHEALAGLNEISWGTKEGQPITPEEDEYYHHMLEQWKNGNTSMRIRGGESPEDVVKRLEPAIAYILSKKEERNVLICMHGRAIRVLLCHVLRRPLSDMDLFKHENLCLYLLNYSGAVFSVEKSNNIDHLRVLS
jgi:broad specificity phosphatase PhoE